MDGADQFQHRQSAWKRWSKATGTMVNETLHVHWSTTPSSRRGRTAIARRVPSRSRNHRGLAGGGGCRRWSQLTGTHARSDRLAGPDWTAALQRVPSSVAGSRVHGLGQESVVESPVDMAATTTAFERRGCATRTSPQHLCSGSCKQTSDRSSVIWASLKEPSCRSHQGVPAGSPRTASSGQ